MTIYPSSVFIPMPPSSEKYMSFANLQLHSHRPPFFFFVSSNYGKHEKSDLPFPCSPHCTSEAGILVCWSSDNVKVEGKKQNNNWGCLPILSLCEQGGFET